MSLRHPQKRLKRFPLLEHLALQSVGHLDGLTFLSLVHIPHVDHRHLLRLVRHCPELRFVKLEVDMSRVEGEGEGKVDEGITPEDLVAFHGDTRRQRRKELALGFMNSPNHSPSRVALWIRSCLWAVKGVEYGSEDGWEGRWGIVDDILRRGKSVEA